MKVAIDTLSKLKDADDITPKQFFNEFGYDLLSWLQELQEYWSKDKDMRLSAPMSDCKPEHTSQEVSILDMMKAGASFGMMSAWDMSRAEGGLKLWWK